MVLRKCLFHLCLFDSPLLFVINIDLFVTEQSIFWQATLCVKSHFVDRTRQIASGAKERDESNEYREEMGRQNNETETQKKKYKSTDVKRTNQRTSRRVFRREYSFLNTLGLSLLAYYVLFAVYNLNICFSRLILIFHF